MRFIYLLKHFKKYPRTLWVPRKVLQSYFSYFFYSYDKLVEKEVSFKK